MSDNILKSVKEIFSDAIENKKYVIPSYQRGYKWNREDVIKQLFAGMAASKLIILEGISGTGKTSLAFALGKFFNFDSAIIPVQPSWKDRSELIGYYNEFTKKFNESEFLKALYVTTYRKDLDVIVLDEMNLARIEYYFAEFLSVMEMRDPADWLIDLIPSPMAGDPQNGRYLCHHRS